MKKILIFVLFLSLFISSFSQGYPKFSASLLTREAIGFNFFMGKDADKFKTTPKALGSGILDFSGQYNLWSIWILKPNKYPVGIATTVGLRIAKYRFTDNYIFTDNGITIDDDINHDYSNAFFSRHGSKLVTGKLFVPILFYFPVHNWFNPAKDDFGIFAGAFYDLYLFSYHKNYYDEDGQFIKHKQRNNYISKYFNKHGVGFRGGLKVYNFFVYAQYMFTPFFSDKIPYKINEAKIAINYYFDLSKLTKKINNNNDLDEYDFGIDAK